MPWIEGQGLVLCEWEVYGQRDAKVYLWTLCEADEAHNGTGVSSPAVLYLGQSGEIEGVESSGDGTFYGLDVQRLFPPDAQERIFAHDFDVKVAERNIALRRQDPSIPPLAASIQMVMGWLSRQMESCWRPVRYERHPPVALAGRIGCRPCCRRYAICTGRRCSQPGVLPVLGK